MRLLREMAAAFALLTRLPMPRLRGPYPAPGDCVWAYPVVGTVVGAAGAAVIWLASRLGLPQPLAALWALAAITLVSGGLHEDGLADTADGFGGGGTVEAKLLIMRDSRIGSFGALALLFSFALRAATLALSSRPGLAMVLAAVLGRGAMLVPLLLLRPARADGLAAALGASRAVRLLAGLAVMAIAGAAAPSAAMAALVAALAVTALARHQIGGYTGDVLGAMEQAAECAALSAMAG